MSVFVRGAKAGGGLFFSPVLLGRGIVGLLILVCRLVIERGVGVVDTVCKVRCVA